MKAKKIGCAQLLFRANKEVPADAALQVWAVRCEKGSHGFNQEHLWNYPLVNQHNYGKSRFFIGKPTINGHSIFSGYVPNYQRVAKTWCKTNAEG